MLGDIKTYPSVLVTEDLSYTSNSNKHMTVVFGNFVSLLLHAVTRTHYSCYKINMMKSCVY